MKQAFKIRSPLYEFLREKTIPGMLNVPVQTDVNINKSIEKMSLPSSMAVTVASHQGPHVDLVRGVLKKTFYPIALIPKALRISSTNVDIMNQELELMRHKVLFWEKDTQKLIGAGCIAKWTVDPDYESFYVDGESWLNTAGEVANDMAKSDAEAFAIWRSLQYQWFYHLCQYFGKASQKQYVQYGSTFFFNKEAKKAFKKSPFEIAGKTMTEVLPRDTCMIFMGTIKGTKEIMADYQDQGVRTVEDFQYQNLSFARNGERVFKECDSMGSVSLFVGDQGVAEAEDDLEHKLMEAC